MIYTAQRKTINSQHALDWAVIGWLGEPGTFIFWSTYSHTARCLAFHRIRDLLMGHEPAIHLPVSKVIHLNGGEEIRMRNGSRVMFRSRSIRSHRGVSADKLILDEAYMLTDYDLGLLIPMIVTRNGEVAYSQTEAPQD